MADNEFPNIPGYRISKQIGHGGMAVVFLAEQERLDRPVAIKVMRPELDSDPSFGDRFTREAKIVAKLTHPNILAIYDVGTTGPYHFMSMELVPGGDLKSRIRAGKIPVADALRITRQVTAALHYAHERGYVHRDVKPENVLFRNDGTAVLSDFGIARAANDAAMRMTVTGTVIGTPSYMSPEQVQGQELDGRSDLYSLGIMFYEMLTGEVPYKGDSAVSVGIKHLRDPIPELSGQLSRFQGMLNKLLAKTPAERFQNGTEIIRAVDAIERNKGLDPRNAETTLLPAMAGATVLLAPQAGVTQPASSTPVRTGIPRLVIAGAAVIALGAGGFFLVRPGAPPATEQPAEEPARVSGNPMSVTAPAAPEPGIPAPTPPVTPAVTVPAEIPGKTTEPAPRQANVARVESEKQAEANRRKALELEQQKIAAAEKAKQDEAERRKVAEQEQLRVAALEKTRQEENERRAREEQLNSLLSQARDYLDGSKLSEARAGRAGEMYREAQRLSPNDSRVQQGPRLVAEAYATLASARADAKLFDEAEALLLKGLEFSPGNSQLLALQKSIADKKSVKKPQRTFGGF